MSGTFHVIARYRTKPGATEGVLDALTELATASRQEPGNLSYEFFRGIEDDRQVVILETYRGPEDFELHRQAPHFVEIGAGRILPNLETRTITSFELPSADDAAA
ncbi:antibiotic biosynthesis monooxygenase family protein [Streptomyces sp. NPDC002896]|uniref:putative quinol monooxygenase n=1 Tax=Streptomyces sp. NPDC002896 TaxID=3154438 RepID=UPI003326E0CB